MITERQEPRTGFVRANLSKPTYRGQALPWQLVSALVKAVATVATAVEL